MKTIYTFFKNSNTGDLIASQEFTETSIKFPVYWYRPNENGALMKIGEDLKPQGYVKMSEKKWRKELKNRINVKQT